MFGDGASWSGGEGRPIERAAEGECTPSDDAWVIPELVREAEHGRW